MALCYSYSVSVLRISYIEGTLERIEASKQQGALGHTYTYYSGAPHLAEVGAFV